MFKIIFAIVFVVISPFLPAISLWTAWAQTPESGAPATPPPAPLGEESVSPQSPRVAIEGFFDAIRGDNSKAAAAYLHPRGVTQEQDAATVAEELYEVLQRKLIIKPEDLSGDADGRLDDGLPPREELLGHIRVEDEDIAIVLERSPAGVKPAWRFARKTVREVPLLYKAYGDGNINRFLPRVFYETEFLSVRLWQWLGLLVTLVLGYVLSWILVKACVKMASVITRRTSIKLTPGLKRRVAPPLQLGLAVTIVGAGVALLRLSLAAHTFLTTVCKTAGAFAAIWLVFRLTDQLSEQMGKRLLASGRPGAYALMPVGRKTIKALLIILALLLLLQNIGINVTALLTGLGVGGLAVALAGQKTVENFIGGLMISVDQPVRVGDFCKFGDRVGTVEDIGLRSVRVRTLDRTVVAVPNAEFSQMQLENFSARDKIRLYTVLGLRYETSSQQMRAVMSGLRKLLSDHPRVDPTVLNVRFVNFNAYSLDVEIFTYINTSDWNEFLAIREDIYLQMMEAVAAAGSGFAFPSQTNYIARDSGLSPSSTPPQGREAADA